MKNDLPPEVQRKLGLLQETFQRGQALTQQRQFKEAFSVFESCFELAAQQRLPLLIDQFVDIMMSIGFCYADLRDWDKALETYGRIEAALKQEQDWFQSIPSGVGIAVPESYDPSLHLAALYDSMGLAYDNLNQGSKAMAYYQRAIEIYQKFDRKQQAAQTWFHFGVGCQRREDWANLQLAGENRLSLCTEIDDIEGKISALQFLAQAYVNQGNSLETAKYLKLVVEAEKQIGHPDLARDEQMLEDFTAFLRQKGITGADAVSQKLLAKAVQVLREFAHSHCGPDREDVTRTKEVLWGLISRQITKEEVYWAVSIEKLQEFRSDGAPGMIPGAVLDLRQDPETVIRVTLNNSEEYTVMIMVEKEIDGVSHRYEALVSTVWEVVPADSSSLKELLNGFLQQGILVKEGNQLRYGGKSV